MRKYIAYADTGRDYIDFEFSSNYRANSKNNFKDAKKHYKKRYGDNVKIIKTYLINY